MVCTVAFFAHSVTSAHSVKIMEMQLLQHYACSITRHHSVLLCWCKTCMAAGG